MPRKAKAKANAIPATGAEGEAPIGLTDSELRFIKAVFDNMTQKPDANWDSVATDLGLKDAKCAKERFRQMSVRHGWRDQASAASSPRKGDGRVTKRAPRTPTKKAAKAVALANSEGEEESVKAEGDETEVEM